MKKTFLLIIIFLFSSQKLLNAVDFGNYLAGESANAKKENKLAINYFKNAIDLDNLDTEYSKDVAKKLCNLYLLEGEINNCVSIGRKIEKNLTSKTIESTNILMALIIGDIKDKNLGSAMNRIKKIRKSSYERFSVPIIEAWLISENDKNLKKAKDKLNELEQDLIVDGLRNLNLALILEYFDKNDDALIYYQKSINSFVQPSYRLVQISANAFERNRDFKKSKDIYIKFLNNSNDYLLIEEELKRIEKKKLPDKIIKSLDDAIAELFITIASNFTTDFTNNFSIIYSHFSLYLKNDFEVAELYLAELLENNRRYNDANNIYKNINPSSNFYWHTKLKTARNLELLGNSNNSISILKKMSIEKKDRYGALKLLGDIYRNNENYKEAIKSYDKAILRIKKIEKKHWDLLYARGIALERNKNWNLAEKDFLKILELEPNQPDVLNYLGYSWIEKNINMKKAKKYIIQAATLRPRDPYIVDSLGWAYFHLKDYNKAVEALERAINLKPTDPIINDHLGDAYYKVNRKLEALYQWKKAVEFKPEIDLKQKIEKKIEKYDENQLEIL